MNNIQFALIVVGLLSCLVLGYLAFAGPSPAKESARRLQSVRYRHSESTNDRVEAQLKRAVAARKPTLHRIAGSESRVAALAMRLHRTGMGWTMSQYLYASAGLALFVILVVFLKTRSAPFALGLGLLIGAGLPHMVVSFSSIAGPTSLPPSFPTRSNCWFAACAPACRLPRRWGSFHRKFPARWARNSSW